MYCEKCRAKISDTAAFCRECGAPVEHTAEERYGGDRRKKWMVIAGAVVIAAVLALVLLGGSGSYMDTIDRYFKAYSAKNAEMMYNDVVSRCLDGQCEKNGEEDPLAFVRRIMTDGYAMWDCGDNITFTYQVIGERIANEAELQELEDALYRSYVRRTFKREEYSLSEARALYINHTVKGEKGIKSYQNNEMILIKENGSWRVLWSMVDCAFTPIE